MKYKHRAPTKINRGFTRASQCTFRLGLTLGQLFLPHFGHLHLTMGRACPPCTALGAQASN